MLKNVKEIFYPENIDECFKLLEKYGDKAELVGGGVDIVWRERKDIEYLIFLEKMSLNYIKRFDKKIVLGSTVTFDELEKLDILRNSFSNSIKSVATPILRNVMTLGGTLARAYSWSDILTIFITLEGKLKLFDGEEKIITIDEFLEYKKNLKRKYIIKEIEIENFDNSFHFSYIRFTRTSSDIPLLNEGVLLKVDGNKIEKINIILGARPGFPIHLKKVEELLLGKELNDELINFAKEVAINTSDTQDDMRLSKDYRKDLAGVLTKRNLIKIKEEL